MDKFSNFDARGDAHMVDVSDKPETARTAIAQGVISMSAQTLAIIVKGPAKKGAGRHFVRNSIRQPFLYTALHRPVRLP